MAHWHDVLDHMVRQRRSALVAYACLYAVDRAVAEDLVQEALVRTFARPRSITDVHAAEGYVRRAIRTAFLDRTRRRRTAADRAHLVALDGTVRGPEGPAVAHVDVMAALAALPPRERVCVILRYFDDLTVRDVAAELGLAEGAVKRYLSDATRTLRVRLGDVLPEDEDDGGGAETSVPVHPHTTPDRPPRTRRAGRPPGTTTTGPTTGTPATDRTTDTSATSWTARTGRSPR